MKSSLGPRPSPIGFDIESVETGLGSVGHVVWSDAEVDDSDPVQTKMDRAKDFLCAALSAGPVLKGELVAQAKDLDIGQRTLEKAKGALDIESRRMGPAWEWVLPDEQRNPADPPGDDAVADMGEL